MIVMSDHIMPATPARVTFIPKNYKVKNSQQHSNKCIRTSSVVLILLSERQKCMPYFAGVFQT